jgi:hypothetical protein
MLMFHAFAFPKLRSLFPRTSSNQPLAKMFFASAKRIRHKKNQHALTREIHQ